MYDYHPCCTNFISYQSDVKELCFIVNVDVFFHSHRRLLEHKLASFYKTSVIAGKTGLVVDYVIKTFEVNSRVPTVRGVFQFYREVVKLNRQAILIIVSPVMIIICHFLLRKRPKVIYNLSGLGFLRSKSLVTRNIILKLIRVYPVHGYRVFVVQNKDDYSYLNDLFGLKKNFYIEMIPGSGYEDENEVILEPKFGNVTIGYVGRIRKDKGVLDLARAVSELLKNGYKLDLKIWGELDHESRHGFSDSELDELRRYNSFFCGFSNNKKEIFNSFNWFCLPSNGEGLSKAAIEASSFKIPLILSNVQGNRDMIDGNGFLFEYSNLESLKNVIIDIIKLPNHEIEVMSMRSRSLFEANWTMEAVFRKWKEILINYDTLSTK